MTMYGLMIWNMVTEFEKKATVDMYVQTTTRCLSEWYYSSYMHSAPISWIISLWVKGGTNGTHDFRMITLDSDQGVILQ